MTSVPCQSCGSLTDNDDRRCDRCGAKAAAPGPTTPNTPAGASDAPATDKAATIRRLVPIILAVDLIIAIAVIAFFVAKG